MKKAKSFLVAASLSLALALNFTACEGGQAYIYEKEKQGYTVATLSNAEIQANCEKYGQLYNWETAMKSCPKDWHLPSKAEWEALSYFVGEKDNMGEEYKTKSGKVMKRGPKNEGVHLKAKSGWERCGSGQDTHNSCQDTYGFAALPGGGVDSDGTFKWIEIQGFWWASSEDDSNYAYAYGLNYADKSASLEPFNNKSEIKSIRCIKD